MDKDLLLIFVRYIAESIAKEGSSFRPESVLSNWEDLVRTLAPTKSISPTQRHAIVTDRHIDDLCKERDRMARELSLLHESHALAIRELRRELTVVIDSHRNRLDWFEPQYEGLKRDYGLWTQMLIVYKSPTSKERPWVSRSDPVSR